MGKEHKLLIKITEYHINVKNSYLQKDKILK